MIAKTKKIITLKTGEVLKAGITISKWNVDGRSDRCQLSTGNIVRVTSCFKAPSIKTLEQYCENGISKSVLGKTVEPDGYDEYGSPSWCLVMGIM
jgi:hypothetical protein